MAREASSAVVIRRGPSKQVGLFGWDRKTDTITPGQWLKGHIYERGSDVSPDGRHMIYFAMNGYWRDPVSKGSWTAISRTPYLKALTFVPWGDCWNGGGLFLDNNRYWLNRGRGIKLSKITDDQRFIEDPDFQLGKRRMTECPASYYPRLVRDGWIEVAREGDRDDWRSRNVTIFEKPLLRGWTMRKKAVEDIDKPVGRGTYRDEHILISPGGYEYEHPDWEWAERDRKDIVYAKDGCLWRQTIPNQIDLAEPELIHDFNTERFFAREAPY